MFFRCWYVGYKFLRSYVQFQMNARTHWDLLCILPPAGVYCRQMCGWSVDRTEEYNSYESVHQDILCFIISVRDYFDIPRSRVHQLYWFITIHYHPFWLSLYAQTWHVIKKAFQRASIALLVPETTSNSFYMHTHIINVLCSCKRQCKTGQCTVPMHKMHSSILTLLTFSLRAGG